MTDRFTVSASPHLRRRLDTTTTMQLVCVSLLPTVVAAVYLFGLRALGVIVASVASCVFGEWIFNRLARRENTLGDFSAVVTGILLAFTLPPTLPLWMTAIGGLVAIMIVKQLFGGLGYNIFNPALAARAFLLACWPVAMTTWIKPVNSFVSVDAITTASPLGVLKEAAHTGAAAVNAVTSATTTAATSTPSYLSLFMGTVPGSLGETCKLTLLIGAALLLVLKIIDWRIPLGFIGAVALLSLCTGRDAVFAVLSGGVILGAFFMATDLVTTPVTGLGKFIFGLGCGVVTVLIRAYGGFPEGVCYSILFMNCLTPLIDRFIQPRVFGTKRAWLGSERRHA